LQQDGSTGSTDLDAVTIMNRFLTHTTSTIQATLEQHGLENQREVNAILTSVQDHSEDRFAILERLRAWIHHSRRRAGVIDFEDEPTYVIPDRRPGGMEHGYSEPRPDAQLPIAPSVSSEEEDEERIESDDSDVEEEPFWKDTEYNWKTAIIEIFNQITEEHATAGGLIEVDYKPRGNDKGVNHDTVKVVDPRIRDYEGGIFSAMRLKIASTIRKESGDQYTISLQWGKISSDTRQQVLRLLPWEQEVLQVLADPDNGQAAAMCKLLRGKYRSRDNDTFTNDDIGDGIDGPVNTDSFFELWEHLRSHVRIHLGNRTYPTPEGVDLPCDYELWDYILRKQEEVKVPTPDKGEGTYSSTFEDHLAQFTSIRKQKFYEGLQKLTPEKNLLRILETAERGLITITADTTTNLDLFLELFVRLIGSEGDLERIKVKRSCVQDLLARCVERLNKIVKEVLPKGQREVFVACKEDETATYNFLCGRSGQYRLTPYDVVQSAITADMRMKSKKKLYQVADEWQTASHRSVLLIGSPFSQCATSLGVAVATGPTDWGQRSRRSGGIKHNLGRIASPYHVYNYPLLDKIPVGTTGPTVRQPLDLYGDTIQAVKKVVEAKGYHGWLNTQSLERNASNYTFLDRDRTGDSIEEGLAYANINEFMYTRKGHMPSRHYFIGDGALNMAALGEFVGKAWQPTETTLTYKVRKVRIDPLSLFRVSEVFLSTVKRKRFGRERPKGAATPINEAHYLRLRELEIVETVGVMESVNQNGQLIKALTRQLKFMDLEGSKGNTIPTNCRGLLSNQGLVDLLNGPNNTNGVFDCSEWQRPKAYESITAEFLVNARTDYDRNPDSLLEATPEGRMYEYFCPTMSYPFLKEYVDKTQLTIGTKITEQKLTVLKSTVSPHVKSGRYLHLFGGYHCNTVRVGRGQIYVGRPGDVMTITTGTKEYLMHALGMTVKLMTLEMARLEKVSDKFCSTGKIEAVNKFVEPLSKRVSYSQLSMEDRVQMLLPRVLAVKAVVNYYRFLRLYNSVNGQIVMRRTPGHNDRWERMLMKMISPTLYKAKTREWLFGYCTYNDWQAQVKHKPMTEERIHEQFRANVNRLYKDALQIYRAGIDGHINAHGGIRWLDKPMVLKRGDEIPEEIWCINARDELLNRMENDIKKQRAVPGIRIRDPCVGKFGCTCEDPIDFVEGSFPSRFCGACTQLCRGVSKERDLTQLKFTQYGRSKENHSLVGEWCLYGWTWSVFILYVLMVVFVGYIIWEVYSMGELECLEHYVGNIAIRGFFSSWRATNNISRAAGNAIWSDETAKSWSNLETIINKERATAYLGLCHDCSYSFQTMCIVTRFLWCYWVFFDVWRRWYQNPYNQVPESDVKEPTSFYNSVRKIFSFKHRLKSGALIPGADEIAGHGLKPIDLFKDWFSDAQMETANHLFKADQRVGFVYKELIQDWGRLFFETDKAGNMVRRDVNGNDDTRWYPMDKAALTCTRDAVTGKPVYTYKHTVEVQERSAGTGVRGSVPELERLSTHGESVFVLSASEIAEEEFTESFVLGE